MKRYITESGKRYLIRGDYSAGELRLLYQKWIEKFPGTTTTFRGWLVGYGKVYCSVNKPARVAKGE